MLLVDRRQLYMDVRAPVPAMLCERYVSNFNEACENFRNTLDAVQAFNSEGFPVVLESIREPKWREICMKLKMFLQYGDQNEVVADLCILLMDYTTAGTNDIEQELFKNLLVMPVIDEIRGEVLHVLRLVCNGLLWHARKIVKGGMKIERALVERFGQRCVRFLFLE